MKYIVALPGACARVLLLAGLWLGAAPVHGENPSLGPEIPSTRLRVVGGLAGVNLYRRHEEPFWTRTLPALTNGRVQAEIVPFDRAGINGQDMLRLLQSGVVPLGTVLLSFAASADPEFAAPDLAGLNPDIASMRRSIDAYRPLLKSMLRDRYGIELLSVYVYPAQVTYCRQPFATLADLRGRRVRVSGFSQADMMVALGAIPVHTSFAEIVDGVKRGSLECAITGTMSGNTIGLHEITRHVHAMAINWGVVLFGANTAAWNALPADLRTLLQRELPLLERRAWDEAERETREGLDCNIGAPGCVSGRKGTMVEVRETPQDAQRRREIFVDVVLPRWIERCGPQCASVWNLTIGPAIGIKAAR